MSNVFNPKNIEVGCMVVICRKEWKRRNFESKVENLWSVVEIEPTRVLIQNSKNEIYTNLDDLIRCPVEEDVVSVYKPRDDMEGPGWMNGMNDYADDYGGKKFYVTESTFLDCHNNPVFEIGDMFVNYHFHPWWLLPEGEVEEVTIDKDMYPHICPRCGSPAYIGLNKIECSKCK